MKFLSMVIVLILSTSLTACSNGNEVSGRSMKGAYRSVNRIKSRLPTEQRIEFELSFWAIRDKYRGDKDTFLDEVGGKTHEEVIAMGKQMFQERKSAGFAEYQKYDNWDHMIAQYAQTRINQNKNKRPEKRDMENSVLYDL